MIYDSLMRRNVYRRVLHHHHYDHHRHDHDHHHHVFITIITIFHHHHHHRKHHQYHRKHSSSSSSSCWLSLEISEGIWFETNSCSLECSIISLLLYRHVQDGMCCVYDDDGDDSDDGVDDDDDHHHLLHHLTYLSTNHHHLSIYQGSLPGWYDYVSAIRRHRVHWSWHHMGGGTHWTMGMCIEMVYWWVGWIYCLRWVSTYMDSWMVDMNKWIITILLIYIFFLSFCYCRWCYSSTAKYPS